jgi:AraC-like DNA-binding protein
MSSRFNFTNNQSKSVDIQSVLSYWDKNLECRFANYETKNWFGLNPSDLAGQYKLEMLLAEDYELHRPFLLEVFKGRSQTFEYNKVFFTLEKRPVIAAYFPDIQLGVVVGFFLHLSLKTVPKDNHLHYWRENAHQNLACSNKIPEVVSYLRTQIFIGFPKLEYLAKIHLISVSKLMRDFKKEHGTSPFLFFRNLQMEFASKHLKKNGYSKKQLALMLGFSNPANFTTCYNKWQRDQDSLIVADMKEAASMQDSINLLFNQLPFAVAILDRCLNFVQVSEKWSCDFLIEQPCIGKNIFEYFPDHSFKWRKILITCLNGQTRRAENDLIQFENGCSFLLNWEVKPWLDVNKNIIGVIIHIPFIKSCYERQQVYFEQQ